jgi:ribosome maturation protein SDO1
MVNVIARVKIKSKHYEISVDFDEAMNVRKGSGDITKAMNSSGIFYNAKSGEVASQKDLLADFGTVDLHAVAKAIIMRGELEKPQEFRDAERELKIKRVVDLIVRNAVDQHGRPYTEDRIRRGIHEVHYNFDNRPPEQQLADVLAKLGTVLPIKIETKRIKLIIPARFSGQIYGLLKDHKEKEEWLPNGDLQVIMNIPAGMQLDFYDKLNGITHGAVVSQELKD